MAWTRQIVNHRCDLPSRGCRRPDQEARQVRRCLRPIRRFDCIRGTASSPRGFRPTRASSLTSRLLRRSAARRRALFDGSLRAKRSNLGPCSPVPMLDSHYKNAILPVSWLRAQTLGFRSTLLHLRCMLTNRSTRHLLWSHYLVRVCRAVEWGI
jgi:hypothetical protein